MEVTQTTLPKTLEDCHAFILQQQANNAEQARTYQRTIAEQQSKIERLTEQYENLIHQIKQLQRHQFGRRSEQLDVTQGDLFAQEALGDRIEDSGFLSEERETIQYSRKKPNRNGHRNLPEDLLRYRIEYDLPEAQKVCPCGCGKAVRKIGEEILEQLEMVPQKMFVLQHVRFKYAGCMNSREILLAEMPHQPIPKGMAGPGLLAEVLVKKYDDHLPLYRQSEIFKRHGIELSSSTLCDWVGSCAALLEPLIQAMKPYLLASPKIHTDDTTVPVQAPGEGQTKRGRLWVYHNQGGGGPPCVIYEYTPDRKGHWAQAFLKEYEGYLQADAYGGYDIVYEPTVVGEKARIVEVGCMAHVRRKFYEVLKASKQPGSAGVALGFIKKLYAIEESAKGMSDEERGQLRREQSAPILEAFKAWLDARAVEVLPKSPLGQAIGYAQKQWKSLTRYLEAGYLEIDNNSAERLIKPLVIGRKNWLFAGSDAGGERAAVIYSLIESCKLNGINPYEYLRDVLVRLPNQKVTELEALLPFHWKPEADDEKQQAEHQASKKAGPNEGGSDEVGTDEGSGGSEALKVKGEV